MSSEHTGAGLVNVAAQLWLLLPLLLHGSIRGTGRAGAPCGASITASASCRLVSASIVVMSSIGSTADDEFGKLSPCQKSGDVPVVMSFQSPWMMQFLPIGRGSA